MKKNQNIWGVCTPLTNHKLMLYDDDVVVMLQDAVNFLKVLGFFLDLLGTASGYNINEFKSVIMGINKYTIGIEKAAGGLYICPMGGMCW